MGLRLGGSMRTLAVVVLLAVPAAASGEEFVCSFATGVAASLQDADWSTYGKATESSPLMLGFVVMSEAQVRKMLDHAKRANVAADVKLAQSLVDRARVTGFSGWTEGPDGYSGPITVIRGDESATLIETTATGNVTVTTLFMLEKTVDGKIPAVHSRHMSMLGRGMVSHYTGACIRKTR